MNGWKDSWPWWTLFLLAALWQGIGYDAFSLRFLQALLLASIPLLPAFALLWWLDRLPPIGARTWFLALGWGMVLIPPVASNFHAFVAVKVAIFLEGTGTFNSEEGQNFGALAGSVLSAPLVEESLKAFVPLWLLCRHRDLSGPWPALLTGCLVALGFGCLETTTVIGRAGANPVSPDAGGMIALLTARGHFPYLHIVFSLPLLLAIGLAVFLPTLSRRLALVFAGWTGSVVLHGLWNWEVYFGNTQLSLAPWYKHAPEASPAIFLATVLLVFHLESKPLARSGVKVPGALRRFGRTDAEGIRRARFHRISAVLDRPIERDLQATPGSAATSA